jgi:hypothetical protein
LRYLYTFLWFSLLCRYYKIMIVSIHGKVRYNPTRYVNPGSVLLYLLRVIICSLTRYVPYGKCTCKLYCRHICTSWIAYSNTFPKKTWPYTCYAITKRIRKCITVNAVPQAYVSNVLVICTCRGEVCMYYYIQWVCW